MRRGRSRFWRWTVGAAMAALAGCTAAGFGWDEVDYCGPDGCIACKSDRECVTGSSCCSHTLFCSHREEGLITCDLGCEAPDPPPCRCRSGRCRFE